MRPNRSTQNSRTSSISSNSSTETITQNSKQGHLTHDLESLSVTDYSSDTGRGNNNGSRRSSSLSSWNSLFDGALTPSCLGGGSSNSSSRNNRQSSNQSYGGNSPRQQSGGSTPRQGRSTPHHRGNSSRQQSFAEPQRERQRQPSGWPGKDAVWHDYYPPQRAAFCVSQGRCCCGDPQWQLNRERCGLDDWCESGAWSGFNARR